VIYLYIYFFWRASINEKSSKVAEKRKSPPTPPPASQRRKSNSGSPISPSDMTTSATSDKTSKDQSDGLGWEYVYTERKNMEEINVKRIII